MESLTRIAADGGEGTLVVAQIEAVVNAERFADLPDDTGTLDTGTLDTGTPDTGTTDRGTTDDQDGAVPDPEPDPGRDPEPVGERNDSPPRPFG